MAEDKEILEELFEIMTERERQGVRSISDQILSLKSDIDSLRNTKIMVAYGGGKDSTYTVAFMRAVQLYIKQIQGCSFILRVANMRHAGVPFAVMQNIHRVYKKLGLLDNDEAELLVIDNDRISPFALDLPMPQDMVEINRIDVLMNGHRTKGDGRPTFCNSCNLSVANFYGLACWHNGGVDFLVTGDSKKEQKHYFTWIMRMGQKIGLDVDDKRAQGFKGVLSVLNKVGEEYYKSLYGDNDRVALDQRFVSPGGEAEAPNFLSIYSAVDYRVDEHWKMVVDYLGFEFDELAFSFTESDCFNPALMAHIRGLKVQYEQGRTYLEGIEEYLGLAEKLMHKKEIPENLINIAMAKYATPEKCMQMYDKVSTYMAEVFGLTNDHLIAMIISPFVDRGARLSKYMALLPQEKQLPVGELHSLLKGEGQSKLNRTSQALEELVGLPINMLQKLYLSNTVEFSDENSLIAFVRKNDPHKHIIQTFDPDTGRPTSELVSGR